MTIYYLVIGILLSIFFSNLTKIKIKSRLNPTIIKNAEPTLINETTKDTYLNTRFGYTVRFPHSWKKGIIAANGDGRILHKDTNGEITVYASNTPHFESYGNDKLVRETFSTKNGLIGRSFVEQDGNKIKYVIYFNIEGKEYVIYSLTDKDFYAKNKKNITEVASSFKKVPGFED